MDSLFLFIHRCFEKNTFILVTFSAYLVYIECILSISIYREMKSYIYILLLVLTLSPLTLFSQSNKGLDTTSLNALIERSIKFSKEKNFDQALKVLSKANYLFPNIYQVNYLIGANHLALKNFSKSILAFTRCITIKPTIVDAYLQRAKAKRKSGSYLGYLKDLSLAHDLNPNNTYMFFVSDVF